jgi:Ni,Fe-hydrogenase maturation factor
LGYREKIKARGWDNALIVDDVKIDRNLGNVTHNKNFYKKKIPAKKNFSKKNFHQNNFPPKIISRQKSHN